MKSAKIFLAGMYLHLLLSITVPVSVIFILPGYGWTALKVRLMVFYLAAAAAVWVLGWVAAGMASSAFTRRKIQGLVKGWKLLKFGSIPFYIVNFIYSLLFWMVIVGGSRGFGILLVPIPIFITCSMIVQSGCFGICCIMLLRGQLGPQGGPSKLHYLVQLLPVLDIIGTVALLSRYGNDLACQPSNA